VKSRSIFRFLLIAFAFAPLGCGVGDYENKMRLADARLDRFDLENKLLGDPLVMPGGDAAPHVMCFLRPPKGVAKNSDTKDGLRYHYPASSGDCTDLYLMLTAKDDKKEDLVKQIENWLGAPKEKWTTYTAAPPNNRPPLAFDAAEFPAPPQKTGVFLVYVRPAASNTATVAVLFHLASAATSVPDAVKMSLETYADSGEAAQASMNYNKRMNR
jgi:hypothetical protein